MIDLEICIDSVESAIAAHAGGAQRVELCSALAEGGLTPSSGLIRAVRARIPIGLFVLIRPRGGDFLYSDEEFSVMQSDIRHAADCGADGVALGLLTAAGDIDVERTKALVALARPMQVTFHRAFDMVHNQELALEDAIQTGANRILTSGAAQTALLGSRRITTLVQAAGNRIKIMVAGSIRPQNAAQIASDTGASDFHAALRTAVPSPMLHQNREVHLSNPGTDEYLRHTVLAEDVLQMRHSLDRVS